MPRGFFLTFEGLDGSGKTTQLRRLAAHLQARHHPLTLTRQPGGTPLGDRIRSLLLDSAQAPISPHAELALMFADRAQSISEIIAPALARGEIVLCDRFTDSTEAYQGGGRQLGAELVLQLHHSICNNLQPDLTILLLADLETSLARARRRNARTAHHGPDESRFEQESTAFYQRVHAAYQALAQREPVRVVTIDSNASIELIHAAIVQTVEARLAQHRRL